MFGACKLTLVIIYILIVLFTYLLNDVVFCDCCQLKKDKVELENQLEQEQEALVNRLWKRMDKLEAEKR